jgi:hypothetical protein
MDTWKGTTLRVMVASRHKVSFWPDDSTSPGNYEYVFVALSFIWLTTETIFHMNFSTIAGEEN